MNAAKKLMMIRMKRGNASSAPKALSSRQLRGECMLGQHEREKVSRLQTNFKKKNVILHLCFTCILFRVQGPPSVGLLPALKGPFCTSCFSMKLTGQFSPQHFKYFKANTAESWEVLQMPEIWMTRVTGTHSEPTLSLSHTKALFHEWVPQSWQFHIEEHSPLSSLGINHAENWNFPAFGKLRFQERSLLPLDSGQDERNFEFHNIHQKTIFGNLWNTSQESKHRKMKLKHYSNQQKNNRKSTKIIAMFHINLFQAHSSLTSVVMRNACAISPNISLGLRLWIHQLLR